jgi:hypothetical protein
MGDVPDEAQRPQWVFTPFENVGPLRFGMTSAQVREALDGLLTGYISDRDPCSDLLGLVIRSQPAGDGELTRPIFVAREWAERCYHLDEGSIPREEWGTFCC